MIQLKESTLLFSNKVKTFFIDKQNVAFYASQIAIWIKQIVEQAFAKGVVLGMSGGIDCSVVARLCQVGGVDVHLLILPDGDDMKKSKSWEHAMELIDKFSFSYQLFDIQPAVKALTLSENDLFCAVSDLNTRPIIELSRANLRPRVRMTCLYQVAQISHRLVIGTGNLAERTMGYFTKWGDGACDLNPLALLTKQEIYTLAEFLEVPDCIIRKQPSAGLWEGQTDEEDMGMTYAQIDAYILNGTTGDPILDRRMEENKAKTLHKHNPIPVFEGVGSSRK